ncbi:AmmeMemoRadiSam system protein B [Candidatus Woesearchaeota archaeon CG10_big_fil_rev_8_21_14_0_10_47_5]|nr:MAG: AmmeMemoRadiSam system protein B [Candidatus Woesearchaeota archaeon CG10_big_fil_rev_8_21_14_0_10_47_5]HII30081.1 AmmeMemoRadiSam system protein B [Candidatus Woesearchaeota archaeon]
MVRRPVVAGQFYAYDPRELEKQIESCFLSPNGPGVLPVSKRKGICIGIIAPHAGYVFSGPCAAWAYKELAESMLPDIFFVLGTDHVGRGVTSTTLEDWETPLGIVKVDRAMAEQLIECSRLRADAHLHAMEHSIEVQLPFLQFITRDKERLRIIPISVSRDIDLKAFALDIKDVLIAANKTAAFIASSDFTHYGRSYGFVPFTSDVAKRMYELDRKALGFIKRLDPEGFLSYVAETGATICGARPIALLMYLVKAKRVKLLQYYTSADIIGDYNNAVGYAAISFE